MRRKLSIIFLDIDGVLNNAKLLKNNGAIDALDPESIKLLNELLRETGANVVITSTWRLGHSLHWLQYMFKSIGFDYPERIIGATMDLPGQPRGKEISLWLKQVPVDAYVIFDDDTDMPGVQDKLIRTFFDVGLTKEHIQIAKSWLYEQLEE